MDTCDLIDFNIEVYRQSIIYRYKDTCDLIDFNIEVYRQSIIYRYKM